MQSPVPAPRPDHPVAAPRSVVPPSSRRRALLPVALLALLAGCEERPIEPALLGDRSPLPRVPLEVTGVGSTAGGVVVAKTGRTECTIQVTARGAERAGRCRQDYATGQLVTLIARPAPGAVLDHWQGCTGASESPNACQVSMDYAANVVAVFSTEPTTYTLTVVGGADGAGRVRSSVTGVNCAVTAGLAATTGCRASFATNAVVTLTATAAAGHTIKAWAGAGCDTSGTGVGAETGSCAVPMSQAQRVVVSFDDPGAARSLGRWDAPIPWPMVAIDASLLPDGRVLSWGRHDAPPYLWSPATGAFTAVERPFDLFCTGHSFLPNGQLFAAGGHSGTDDLGIRDAQLFDFRTDSWTAAPMMQNGRWYPTNTTLPNGEVLVVSGGDTLMQRNLIPEIYQADGTWRTLSTASLYLPYYPFMYVAPDGRVFAAGPAKATYYLNTTGTGSWRTGPSSRFGSRSYGSSVMYDAGKILIVGGGTPTNTAEVINLNAATKTWRSVASMSVARRHADATLLPDGTVLVTGGTNGTGFNGTPTSAAVLVPELWDPQTEKWTKLARMSHHRVYHSTALLLPDGRVLVAGSGQPAAVGLTDDRTAEIFSPPYLFNADGTPATRPTIAAAPTEVTYGQSFQVETPDAANVAKVTWIALGTVTHAFNMGQRMNHLSFAATGEGTVTVTAPAGPTLAPPGYYMLFLVDARGVPSVATIVRID